MLTVGGEARAFTDPYAVVALELERYRTAPLEGLPPFAGGAVGLFGYDLVRFAEPSVGEPNPDPLDMPDMALMVSDVMVAFDHLRHEATILANVFVDGAVDDAYASAAAAIAEVRQKLAEPVPQFDAAREAAGRSSSPTPGEQGFEDSVARCVEYIHAGDAYQVVPSQRWSAEAPGRRVLDLPRPARGQPQPVHVLPGLRGLPDRRRVAGVAGQGRGPHRHPAPDRRHPPARATAPPRTPSAREELLADDKERAEHVMLVDLSRNDLGRVCEYGSVTVDELMVVETYSHVLHIVSEVSGTLREDVSPIDTLRACLPAGTLSGAPKIRAMQIIDELEPVKRGPYGGSVGYLSYSGELDTCIYIRSALIKDGLVHAQAGGGVVADSDPAYERRESEAKAGAVFQAIELARTPGGLGVKVVLVSTTTTRSPTTWSSTWASWARRSTWSATTRPRSTSC